MGHPVHEAMQRIHGVMRIADGAGTGLAEVDDALRAAACQPVAIFGHAVERIEAHRLRGDVDITHALIERRYTDDVGRLVDGMELHRFVRADDAAAPVGPAPYAIVIVHHHHRLDLLAQLHVKRSGIAGYGGAFDDAL